MLEYLSLCITVKLCLKLLEFPVKECVTTNYPLVYSIILSLILSPFTGGCNYSFIMQLTLYYAPLSTLNQRQMWASFKNQCGGVLKLIMLVSGKG